MKDYFGFTVSSDDDDKIMSSFKNRAKDKVEVYDDILVEYRINPKYPCKRLMEEARKRLAEILDINEPTEFFKTVDKKRDDVLEDFTGNKELILQANNAAALAKMIKWASTTASMVSAPASKPMNADAVSTPAGSGDPFAPANGGAPLVIDMSNIPSPDDFDDGAVW